MAGVGPESRGDPFSFILGVLFKLKFLLVRDSFDQESGEENNGSQAGEDSSGDGGWIGFTTKDQTREEDDTDAQALKRPKA